MKGLSNAHRAHHDDPRNNEPPSPLVDSPRRTDPVTGRVPRYDNLIAIVAAVVIAACILATLALV